MTQTPCSTCRKPVEINNGFVARLVSLGKAITCYDCRNGSPDYKGMPYKKYLKTAHWQATSKAIRKRDGHKCRLCNDGGLTDVHHRTYENLGREKPTDLITLCRRCHKLYEENKR